MMTDTIDNPPAFPTKGAMAFYFPEELRGQIKEVAKQVQASYGGMTLRDYFAAASLPGLLARRWDLEGLGSDENIIEIWGKSAYAVADAMLRARKESDHG
jgi:hypothetical protein